MISIGYVDVGWGWVRGLNGLKNRVTKRTRERFWQRRRRVFQKFMRIMHR